jgi:hypothetical protein
LKNKSLNILILISKGQNSTLDKEVLLLLISTFFEYSSGGINENELFNEPIIALSVITYVPFVANICHIYWLDIYLKNTLLLSRPAINPI